MIAFVLVVFLAFCALIGRLTQVQILEGERFAAPRRECAGSDLLARPHLRS
jgi:cell division protein FtsI/penicillin-binding protein 2